MKVEEKRGRGSMKISFNHRTYEFRKCDVENITQDELQRLADERGHMQYEPRMSWLVIPGIGYGWEV